MSKPTNLPDHTRRHLDDLITSCPEMTTLAARIREFAAILTQRRGQDLAAYGKTNFTLLRKRILGCRPGRGPAGWRW
jgi:hypothetical protein